MLYFLHGTNQKDLKDHLFDLKKRAPLVEEIDASLCAWDEFYARVKTPTFLFSKKKTAARLIIIFSFIKSPAPFQESFFAHARELALLPDVIALVEENEARDKPLTQKLRKIAVIKCFDEQKKEPARDPFASVLFECAGAWARGDRARALSAADTFFEQGGAPEQLLGMLAAYAKKRKTPYLSLRALRDAFIASRLENADARSLIFAFLAR